MIAVVFDMDGVIFDTEAICWRAWHACAGKYNIQDVDALLIPTSAQTNNICGKFFMSSWAKISLWKLLTRMPGKVFSGSREKRESL